MSIEDALKELTAALKENTARLDKMLGGAAAPKSDKSADKPADKAPAAGKKAAPKAATMDDLTKAAGEYMKTGVDGARENLLKIAAHFGAAKISGIEAGHITAALAMVKTYAAGETPDEFAGEEGGEEDDAI
jgi:hypothetical protein